MSHKCKILHLPSATFMWHDSSDASNCCDYFYSEYEYNKGYFDESQRTTMTPVFRSIKLANKYLTYWSIETKNPDYGGDQFCFSESEEAGNKLPFLLAHFSIVKVQDENV